MSLTPSLNVFKNRALLLVLMSITAITACMCHPYYFMGYAANDYCQNRFPDTADASECSRLGYNMCSTFSFQSSFESCMQSVVNRMTVESTINQTPLLIVTPSIDCSPFKLTSPLGGLPNGTTTFYWDPLPNAQRYEISLFDYDSQALLATFSADGSATNLVADVSTGAIGGLFTVTMSIQAYIDDRAVCSDVHISEREAPAGAPPSGGSAPVVPTSTPDFGTPEPSP